MTVRAAFLVLTVCLVLAGCSDQDDASRQPAPVPSVSTSVAPGGLVPWAALPLPSHPVKTAPATLIPSLAAPGQVRAGDDLVFEVTLANRATTPYAPEDCPIYVAWLHTGSDEPVNIAGEPLTLNCVPALPIPPGGEGRFAMELRVPASTPGGPWLLSWGFASPTGTYGTVANVPVEVRPR